MFAGLMSHCFGYPALKRWAISSRRSAAAPFELYLFACRSGLEASFCLTPEDGVREIFFRSYGACYFYFHPGLTPRAPFLRRSAADSAGTCEALPPTHVCITARPESCPPVKVRITMEVVHAK